MQPNNLFHNLFRWAHRQDENFLTESFVFLVNYLLDHDQDIGIALLKWLCFGNEHPEGLSDERPVLHVQYRTEHGVPDIKIEAANWQALVEVKKESKTREGQLTSYKTILSGIICTNNRLVLLTRYPYYHREEGTNPDRHVTWHQVAMQLRTVYQVKDRVSRFLIDQFVTFLERARMSIQHIDQAYISGMEAFRRLVTMIERALNVAGIKIYKKPRIGRSFWVCYLRTTRDKEYCLKIRFDRHDDLNFEFNKTEKKLSKQFIDQGWNRRKKKYPCRTFHMGNDFFALEAEQQLVALTKFASECNEQAIEINTAL